MKRLGVVVIVCAVMAATAAPAGAVASGGDAGGGPFVVVMSADPLVASQGLEGITTRAAQATQQELETSHDQALVAVGIDPSAKIHDYTTALNGFSVSMTAVQAELMSHAPGVALVLPDVMRFPTTDSSPDFIGLTGRRGPWAQGLDGRGVVIGIIDTGIWPEHPSFADDGSYPAPPTGAIPCEFGNTAHNPNDVPFTCNNKLIGARQMLDTYRSLIGAEPDEFDSARDDAGHGTHTASTTAGNGGVEASIFGIDRSTISGIAPRAHIIAYKGLGNEGGFSSDLAAAIDQAVIDGVDVINYSIGSDNPALGADDIAFLFAADAGVFVATSAGNSGPGASTVGSPASAPWVTSVGASTQRRFFEEKVVLGNGRRFEGASITPGTDVLPLVDAAAAGNEFCDPNTAFTSDVSGKIVLCRRGVVGRIEKSLAVFEAGGAGMVMYNESDADNLFTDNHWVPTVHIDLTPGLAIKAYIAAHPGTATARITDRGNTSRWRYAPSMTIFSSRGPNALAPDIIKPDITAPGLQILAGYSPFPDPGTEPPGELFAAIAGTSMSSPHVAGLLALLKQAHPDWSAAMAKSALMTTASQRVLDNDRVNRAGPFAAGSGHVDIAGESDRGTPFEPGLVYDAGLFEYAAFTCGADLEVFTPDTCAFLESIGIPMEPENLNVPSIGISNVPGTKTVTRTVTSVAPDTRKYRVSVQAPPGFTVSVSPSTITLNPGESASYEVTVTSISAPLGEWRFGSLNWRENRRRYDVNSPIAVNASAFETEASVMGTGTDGSATIPVSFGYTGSYTATAHGLIEPTITPGNVLQDPDQDFDPDDGFSTAHVFTITDAEYFRVAIPPEATEVGADLDLFLFDPNGELFVSGNAGTDEVLEFVQPVDGTWTLFVHGFTAPDGDSDYNLSSWVVPNTTGGSLTIASAPPSAVIGTIGEVVVTWSGLSPSLEYFGTVSHIGPSGLLATTVVEVDTGP